MSINLKQAVSLTLQAATLVAATPLLVHAQSTAGGLEEVVVTAQRREQNQQDLGVSITALGSNQIHALGVTNATDIGRVAPGVIFAPTSSGGAFATLSIRGIAQSDYSPIQESPNSVYMDDVYLSSNGAVGFATYDLERIEVLRGPQGTLFGRNSTGGLANFVSTKPTETFDGYFEAGAGSYNEYWLEGAVSGPLTDRVRGRLAFKTDQADGWWENRLPGGNDTIETDARGVRGQLEVDLTDNLLARLSINYTEQPRHAVGTYKQKNFYLDANGVPRVQPADLDAWGTGPGNNVAGYRDPYEDKRVGAFQDFGFTRMKSTSPTLLLQWTLGSTTLSSLTNYTDFQNRYLEDTDGSPVDWSKANQDQSLKQWSQEFKAIGKFGPHTWTAGLYYLDIDTTVYADYIFPALSGSDFAFDVYQNIDQRTRSWAPYGQIEWVLTDTLRLTTGLRYTHDNKTFDSQVYFRELGNGYSGGTGSTVFPPPGYLVYDFRKGTVGRLAERDEGLVSGKVQLDYKPNEDLLLYAGVSRGVKGAGFNANLGGGMTNEETPFKSEAVLTYEIGAKSEWLDNRLRLNGSAYYYDYNDYQGFAFSGVQGVVGNYKGAFYGADLEMLAELPGDVRLNLGVAYAHTQLKDVPSAYLGVQDVRAVLAPEWTINGTLGKTIQVGPGSLSMAWSFDYLSDRYASVDNNPATYVGGSTEHNLRVAYELEDSGLEFAAFVNNVTNEERQIFAYEGVASQGWTINVYDRPRWYGVSVRKKF